MKFNTYHNRIFNYLWENGGAETLSEIFGGDKHTDKHRITLEELMKAKIVRRDSKGILRPTDKFEILMKNKQIRKQLIHNKKKLDTAAKAKEVGTEISLDTADISVPTDEKEIKEMLNSELGEEVYNQMGNLKRDIKLHKKVKEQIKKKSNQL